MFVVGLTGGIGSGKSTVAALFASKGVPIIDADELARYVIESNTSIVKKIAEIANSNVFSPNGKLNRSFLREIIFKDEIKRKKLEMLLHPLIWDEIKLRINKITAPYCIAVIPLLVESNPSPLINRILVIDTSEDLQIARTIARDMHTREQVERILKSQTTRQNRLNAADDIIMNDGLAEDLIQQVEKLHALYLSLAYNET